LVVKSTSTSVAVKRSASKIGFSAKFENFQGTYQFVMHMAFQIPYRCDYITKL
jgi:hypothetical protein